MTYLVFVFVTGHMCSVLVVGAEYFLTQRALALYLQIIIMIRLVMRKQKHFT